VLEFSSARRQTHVNLLRLQAHVNLLRRQDDISLLRRPTHVNLLRRGNTVTNALLAFNSSINFITSQ